MSTYNDDELQGRLLLLAERLLVSTQRGRISWDSSDNDDTYAFAGSETSVLVNGAYEDEGEFAGRMEVLNSQGVAVESLSARLLTPDQNAMMERLYMAARRSALDIDSVLDSIFNDLQERESPTPH